MSSSPLKAGRSQDWQPDPSGASDHLCREVMGRKPARVDPSRFLWPGCARHGSTRAASLGTSGPLAAVRSLAFKELPTLERKAPVPQNEPITPILQIQKAHGHAGILAPTAPPHGQPFPFISATFRHSQQL